VHPGVTGLLERFTEVCAADPRVVAAFVGGSIARGEDDSHSDVDLCAIATAEGFGALVSDRPGFVRRLGDPLFLEDFGNDHHIFFVLADGAEGEIFFVSESELDDLEPGPVRALHDERGLLADRRFRSPEMDPERLRRELERLLQWFWHDLSHFIAASGRGQRWWAAGQLEALRRYCVNLIRIERGVEPLEEAYEKVDDEVPLESLRELEETFVPFDADEIARAGSALVALFRDRGRALAKRYEVDYPDELDRIMSAHLGGARRGPGLTG
jgi:predicted nucleotidyltransferase